jgi:microcystin-dependent protein
MATLTVTNTYIAGTLAKASEVNQNFNDIINWAAGNIQNDNIGTLSGPITWSITTGVQAISIANSGSEGSMTVTQSALLTAGKAIVLIDDNASSSSNTLALDVQSDARGVRLSAMTEVNRDAIIAPSAGTLIYNTDAGQYQSYDGSSWGSAGGSTADIKMTASSTIPSGWLECDGSAVSRTTYAALFAALNNGADWGTGDGSTTFDLPDLRGRAPMGAGTGTGLTARALGSVTGNETVTLSAAESGTTAHTHPLNGSGATANATNVDHRHFTVQYTGEDNVLSANTTKTLHGVSGSGGYTLYGRDSTEATHNRSGGATEISGGGSMNHTHTIGGTSGSSTTASASSAHNNMAPRATVTFIIKT